MSDCRLSPNKMQFLNEQDAKEYLRGLKECKGVKNVKLYIYHCPNCKRWHYTSKKRPAQRRIQRLAQGLNQ